MLNNVQPLTANQRQRIADPKLQEYLDRIAHNIVRSYHPGADPEDLLSVMNTHIVEQAARDPTFLDQKPGYISRSAAWAAYHYCEHEQCGRKLQPQSLDREDDGIPAGERIPAPLADLGLPIDIRNALAALSEKRQRIAAMLVAGFQRREIAEAFGVKSPSLSWDFTIIKRALQPVHAAAGV